MSELRTRIAQALYGQILHPVPLFDSQPDEVQAAWLADADAVLAELDLEKRIEIAIQSYAQSEMGALSYHDPHRRETAYEAMEKLNREAREIGRYAMSYRKRDDG